MNRRSTFLALAFVVGVTLAGEWLSSRLMGRHQQQDLLARATAEFSELPQHFGNWQLRSEETLSENAVRVLECPAYFNRQYVHAETGQVVNATLLVGPAGPMVAHRPEICFTGSNYTLIGEPQRVTVRREGAVDHEFFVSQFQSQGLLGQKISAYYGWFRGTRWEAPENTRLTLGGEPVLFKLQVVCETDSRRDPASPGKSSDTTAASGDIAIEFLNDLLPVLQPHLVQATQ